MQSSDGHIRVPGGRVWYTIMGRGPETPLLVLHGGPGSTHDCLKSALGALAADRPVIFYDQLGSGRSDRPADSGLWHTERFVEELAQLRHALGLKEMHLLGHSWGTMLAASYLIDRKPQGVRSVVFSSPCLSAELWKRDADRYLEMLPEHVRATIARCEEEGNTESEEYDQAIHEYYGRHVCRLDPWPEILQASSAKSNRQVYMTMWGPSEFSPTGHLRTFDVTPRLHEIRIPSLFVCGRHDEAAPDTTRYYQSLVEGAEFHVFEQSAHMSYLEETEEYLKVVRGFLRKVETVRSTH